MAVVVQQQVIGKISGVAFSRDPITRAGDAVVIEALPGGAEQVVSGQRTPHSYRVWVQETDLPDDITDPDGWQLPDVLELQIAADQVQTHQEIDPIPSRLLQQVAFLARHLERRYGGLPQDVEWTFDGERLWLLQSRPITTLHPLWTRKIAAEVIPGLIRPLTWSINRPLTCGVWGEIFTLVLGKRARGLDFESTATLHHSRAYFNASCWGIFSSAWGCRQKVGISHPRGQVLEASPQRHGAQPAGAAAVGPARMAGGDGFSARSRHPIRPIANRTPGHPRHGPVPPQLLSRVEQILTALRRATYYNILAPSALPCAGRSPRPPKPPSTPVATPRWLR
jgi:hypothetical protein